MTPDEYRSAVARTANVELPKHPPRLRVWNWYAGLAGELGELNAQMRVAMHTSATDREERIIEEAGDVLWYAVALCSEVGAMVPELHPYPVVSRGDWADLGVLAEHLKKWSFHGRDLDPERITALVGKITRAALYRASTVVDATVAEIMAANVAKLKARHPSGFSTAYMEADHG